MEEQHYSIREVAEKFNVSYWTVKRMIVNYKTIKGFKIGKKWRIPASEVAKISGGEYGKDDTSA
jgi:excisionase family DNA binding protein